MTTTLRLPWPPSVNTCWRSTPKGVLLSKRGRQFRNEVIADAQAEPCSWWPHRERLRVCLELSPPTRAKRDIDNHTKAPLDALTHAGVIEDDELIDELIVKRLPVTRGGYVDVTIQPVEAEA